jgi:signal transduction histidine kinase/phenylalanine-4-hydroxylase/CheY-like chemotaxis protein
MSWTSPSHAEGGHHLVELDRDHPGFRDLEYRERRNRIAQMAFQYQGGPVADVLYTEDEHQIWRQVWEKLAPLHQHLVPRSILEVHQRLGLNQERIPQFSEINPALWRVGGFQLHPVAGMVELRTKLSFLADSVFLGTQYVRHPSAPFFTPEPDVIHELIGHTASFTHPIIAALHRSFGRASKIIDDERMVELERVYWWTMEYGGLREDGQVKAFGAALLSSADELLRLNQASELMPFDIERMAQTPYEPTATQPKIFVADSWEVMYARLSDWLDELTTEEGPPPIEGQNRYLRILHDFAVSMLGARSIDELLWIVTSGVVARLGYEDCVIYLVDETREVLVQRAAHGPKNPLHRIIKAKLDIPVGAGIVGSVAASKKGEIVPNVMNDPRYLIDDKARSSEMSVPIMHEGKVLGVLDSEHSQEGFYTQEDFQIFETLASMLAIRLVVERERHAQESHLRHAIEVAEEATRAKTRFLGNISHEVRTPLVAILGLTEMVQGMVEGRGPQRDILENLQVVHRSSKHLLSLLNQLIDLSSDEQGELKLEARRCVPDKLLAEVYHLFQHKAVEKGLQLNLTLGEDLPEYATTDPTRLRQILVNLVDNAIKFTDRGSVDVSLTKEESSLIFRVKDSGCGISSGQVQRVFESFFQTDTSSTRVLGGVGLGLAISKRLAVRLGGDLSAYSTEGQGAEFTLEIPLILPDQEIETPTPSLVSQELPARSNRSLRLLVAEDNLETQRLIAFHLRDAGHQVYGVPNGRQALEVALQNLGQKTEFDAVLLDMQMPELDGFEVAHGLRSAGYRRPIIALTAHALPDYRAACFEAGCSTFFAKPFEWAELLAVLAAEAE